MNKYECEADYTITHVLKKKIIEANSWEEAKYKFNKVLGDTDPKKSPHLVKVGYEITRIEEVEE